MVVWLSDCVALWLGDWMVVWLNGYVNRWLYDWVFVCLSGCVPVCMGDYMVACGRVIAWPSVCYPATWVVADCLPNWPLNILVVFYFLLLLLI